MKKQAPANAPLLFAWEPSGGFFTWLPLFIFFSLLAHFATFFVFRVVYPERASLPPAPPQITMLLPTVENASLLRWIEAEDPSLMATAPALEPPHLVKAEYRPSYGVIRTAPRSIAEDLAIPNHPDERAPLAIIRSGENETPEPAAAIERQPTALTFSGGLAGRAVAHSPALHFTKATAPLNPVKFLLGVTARGEVRFVFAQGSSGNTKLDAEAEAFVHETTFAASDVPIVWGFANLNWGDDAYSPQTSP